MPLQSIYNFRLKIIILLEMTLLRVFTFLLTFEFNSQLLVCINLEITWETRILTSLVLHITGLPESQGLGFWSRMGLEPVEPYGNL